LLDTLRGEIGIAGTVMVTSDGKRIIGSANDKTVRIWDIYPTGQELVEESQHLAPRCLSLEQRRRFHLTSAPPSWCDAQHKWPNAGDAYVKEDNLTAAADSYRARVVAAERASKS